MFTVLQAEMSARGRHQTFKGSLMNENDGIVERPSQNRGDEGAEVEGHIRIAHSEDVEDEIRIAHSEDAEEGAEVEGHIRPMHTEQAGPRFAGPAASAHSDDDAEGPDVEGHSARF